MAATQHPAGPVLDLSRVSNAPVWTPTGEIRITSHAEYEIVAERRKTIRTFLAGVQSFFKDMKDAAYDAHRKVCERERQSLKPAQDDLEAHDRALKAWDDEQARLAAEERRRREEQARKDEEARRLAEAAALEREATSTGDAALLAEAEALISEPVEVPAVIVQKATPKVEGLRWRDNWKFEVVDAAKVPREWCAPDLKAIGAHVRTRGELAKIPGVRIWNDRKPVTSISGGAA